MKRKLYIEVILLLTMTLTATAQIVRVPYSCGAGYEFTISIPVKFPAKVTTVQYAWYRNDTLIAGTQKLLLPNEKAIAYTIPASKAYGENVAFHFKYCLDDECSDVWTKSPRYLISFYALPPPQLTEILGDTVVCAGTFAAYSVAHEAGVNYTWAVSPGWKITSGQGSSRVTVTAGTAGGIVSVTPANYNGSGNTVALNVSIDAATVPGVAGVVDYICSDVSDSGVASVVDYSCSDISDPGVAGVVAYTCTDITSAGVISVVPY